MTWVTIAALFIATLGLLPMLLMARLVNSSLAHRSTGKRNRHGDSLSQFAHSVRGACALLGGAPPYAPSARTPHPRALLRAAEARHVASMHLLPAGSDYTFHRRTGRDRREVSGDGGFARVAFQLTDRDGTGYTLHRRLPLN